ncbi:MAG: hypothetical protein HY721_01725 [Planctomycetes bacterium]|nr:hypothetical protein [Planctomycetota bacterium]
MHAIHIHPPSPVPLPGRFGWALCLGPLALLALSAASRLEARTLAELASDPESCVPGAAPLPLEVFALAGGDLGAQVTVNDALTRLDVPAALDGLDGANDGRVALRLEGFPAIEVLLPTGAIDLEVSPDLPCPEGESGIAFRLRGFQLALRLNPSLLLGGRGEPATFRAVSLDLEVAYALGDEHPRIQLLERGAGGGAGLGAAGTIDFELEEDFAIEATGVTVKAGATLSFPATLDTRALPRLAMELRGVRLAFGGLLSFLTPILDGTTFSASIRKRGLSGTFALPLEGQRVSLFGDGEPDLTLESFELRLAESSITSGSVTGRLTPPFFHGLSEAGAAARLELALNLQQDGNVRVAFVPEGEIELGVAGVFDLAVKAIDLELHGDRDYRFRIDGDLKLRFLEEIDGSFDAEAVIPVERLTVSRAGQMALDGGWARLPSPQSFDFHGFEVTVRAVGFGSDEETGRKWIGLDAEVGLTEVLPLRGSVHGFRYAWVGGADAALELGGIEIDFRQPGVVSFLGAVSWEEAEERFSGRVRLSIEAIQLGVDARLTVGKLGETRYFFVDLFSEFPAGVPVFTGVSLYGIGGLFASNLVPDIEAFDSPLLWYAEHERCSDPLEACGGPAAPWRVADGALSFGAGALIGSSDNGYAVHAKATLLISIPSILITFNGKANVLKKRGSLSRGDDPIFNAYVTYDAGSFFEMGVGVNYELAPVIKVQGDTEAYFNLADPSDWHVYLGKIGGGEIRARVAELFEAKAYQMIHPARDDVLGVEGSPFTSLPDLAFGGGIGYDADFSAGPLGIALRALIAAWAGVNFDPIHFQGGMDLDGGVELYAFGFSAGFDVGAALKLETPSPFLIDGKLHVKLKLPWPLPDPKATVHLHWGNDRNPAPVSPALKEVSVSAHDGSRAVKPRLAETDELDAGWLGTQEGEPAYAPLVPLDFAPHLVFHRLMNDLTGQDYDGAVAGRCAADTVREGAGAGEAGTRYAYFLTELEVATKDFDPDVCAYRGFVVPPEDLRPRGVWLPQLGEERSWPSRVLKLNDRNPFSHLAACGLALDDAGGGGGGGAAAPRALEAAVPDWIPDLDIAEWLWRRDCAPCGCYPCQPPPPPIPCTAPPCPPPSGGSCEERCRGSGPDGSPCAGAGTCVSCVWLPYTVYRVKVVTVVRDFQDRAPGDDGLYACGAGDPEPIETRTHYAYFHTQGPPLSLAPYVHEVVPADPSVPHFLGYHLAVRFNRHYVRLLYNDPRVDLAGASLCAARPALIARVLDEEGAPVADVSAAIHFGKAAGHVDPTQLENDDILHVPLDGVPLKPGVRYILQLAWKDERLARDLRLEAGAPEGVKLLAPDEVSLFESPFLASRFGGLRALLGGFGEREGAESCGDEGYRGTYFEMRAGDGADWARAAALLAGLEPAAGEPRCLASYARRLRDAHPAVAPTGADLETVRLWAGRVEHLLPAFDGLRGADLIAAEDLTEAQLERVRELWQEERTAFDRLEKLLDLERWREPVPEVVELSVLVDAGGEHKGFLLELPEPLDTSRLAEACAREEGGRCLRAVGNAAGTRLFFFDLDRAELDALAPGPWALRLTFLGFLPLTPWRAPPLLRTDGCAAESATLLFELGRDIFR